MTAKATLFLSDPEPLLAVPNEALIRHNGTADIYKIKNNIAHIVRVELGGQRGAQTIIRKGLSEGDSIVVVGQKLLGTNSKVWIETVH
jgi:multidrug efflux pump subunit AcrA (membrane-fusion protein)